MNEIVWRKSRRSDEQGGNCVELAALSGDIGIRDSTDPEGPKLILSRSAYRSLIERVLVERWR